LVGLRDDWQGEDAVLDISCLVAVERMKNAKSRGKNLLVLKIVYGMSYTH
jgi:hypothetical protein